MKILVVCDYYQYLGGAEQYVLSLIEHLESLGQKICIVYGQETQDTLKIQGRGEYFIPAVIEENPINKSENKILDKIVQEENPNIIYVQNVKNPYVIQYLSRQKPVVRFVHDLSLFCLNWRKILPSKDIICPYPAGLRCIFNAYSSRCISRNPWISFRKWRFNKKQLKINRQLDKLIVASFYMKTCLIQNGFSPDRIEVIPYYTEPKNFDRVDFKNFLLFVGRIHETKGLQHLLMALKACPDEIKLIVIGEGDYMSKIEILISQNKLDQRVEFLGWRSQEKLQEYYLNCLALVVPSLWPEPFGIVGIEAMSYRKPVIAFDVGGISDWLEDGANGFLVERNNIDALAEKINFLYFNTEKAIQMGEEAEIKFKNLFTKDRHTKSLLKIFNGLNQ